MTLRFFFCLGIHTLFLACSPASPETEWPPRSSASRLIVAWSRCQPTPDPEDVQDLIVRIVTPTELETPGFLDSGWTARTAEQDMQRCPGFSYLDADDPNWTAGSGSLLLADIEDSSGFPIRNSDLLEAQVCGVRPERREDGVWIVGRPRVRRDFYVQPLGFRDAGLVEEVPWRYPDPL